MATGAAGELVLIAAVCQVLMTTLREVGPVTDIRIRCLLQQSLHASMFLLKQIL